MQKKMSKKRLAFILVAVCLVGLIGIGISYSYYLANIITSNEENKNSNITTTTITNVVMDMQGKVSSNGAYPGHKMVKEVVVRGIGESTSLPANASIKITPDLGDFSEDVTWKLYKSDSVITCSSTLHKEGNIYEEATCNIPANASLVLEGSSITKYKNIVVNPNTETKYYLVVEYLNKTDIDQSSQMGKSFSVDIGLQEKLETLTLNNLLTDSISQLSAKNTIELSSDDPDNNVRYIGADPNNYVYFNCSDYANQSDSTCEKWRIIGLFNNMTKVDGSKENLIKIIRDDSLGDLSWDYKQNGVGSSSNHYGSNDWTDSQLMMMLNPVDYLKSGYTNANDIISYNNQEIYSKMGSYYNGTKGCQPAEIVSGSTFTCTEIDFTSNGLKNDHTRNAIETVVWNLGSSDGGNGVTSSMFYESERGTTVYSGRPTTWTGKIGLMYPSDYGYATSGGSTSDRQACLAKDLYKWYDLSDCKNNDYLFKSNYRQWTLASLSSYAFIVLHVDATSYVGLNFANAVGGVRPAAFLKSSIQVDKGTGSESDPYQLKIS